MDRRCDGVRVRVLGMDRMVAAAGGGAEEVVEEEDMVEEEGAVDLVVVVEAAEGEGEEGYRMIRGFVSLKFLLFWTLQLE